MPTINRELGSYKELRTVGDVLREDWTVQAGQALALPQRVGSSTDRDSVIIGCELHIISVQLAG